MEHLKIDKDLKFVNLDIIKSLLHSKFERGEVLM
jgi:hypothetical protein